MHGHKIKDTQETITNQQSTLTCQPDCVTSKNKMELTINIKQSFKMNEG